MVLQKNDGQPDATTRGIACGRRRPGKKKGQRTFRCPSFAQIACYFVALASEIIAGTAGAAGAAELIAGGVANAAAGFAGALTPMLHAASSGTIISATLLMNLINGFTP